MKLSFLLALFAAASVFQVTAQDAGLVITPHWKVGDARTLSFVDVNTAVMNGDTTVDRDEIEADYSVVNEDPGFYTLEIEYDNVVLRQAQKLSQVIGEDAVAKEKLLLRYSVDRNTGAAVLQNWQEVQHFVKDSYGDILSRMDAKDPDNASIFNLIMLPILSVFDSRENVEAYFSRAIEPITSPFGKRLIQGDTLREEQRCENPFAPGDSIGATVLTTLVQVDHEKQEAVIRTEIQMDLREYVQAMKNAMGGIMRSVVADTAAQRETQEKMNASVDPMRMDMTNERLETVDLNTTWPIGATTTVHMVADAGDMSRDLTMIYTVTVTEFLPDGGQLSEAVQDSGLYVYGVVKNAETPDSIPFPTITYHDINAQGPATDVGSTGKGTYELYLAGGKIYRIDFSAEGKMTKSVEIDLKHVPTTIKAEEFAVNLDMTLSDALPGLHAAAFEKPIGMCRYDAPTENMAWDMEYTGKIRAERDAAMEKYRRKHKEKGGSARYVASGSRGGI